MHGTQAIGIIAYLCSMELKFVINSYWPGRVALAIYIIIAFTVLYKHS